MNVKKFTAPTSREALRKVREALGPDAVILSNRAVDGAVEILALAGDDAAALAPHSPDSPMSAPAPHLELAPALVSQPAAAVVRATARQAPAAPRAPARPIAPAPAPAAPAVDMDRISSLVAEAVASAKATAAAEMTSMMSELRAMRGMMETQLNELAFANTQQREPHKTVVLREMLAAGFSASLARYLTDKLPAARDGAEALQWMRTVLARNINAMSNEDALLEKGGVFALVGPTGVGKTTTTAKLAARCVMRHGPEKLALITTDAYRIGAHEQLRIYGKILGVMVHSVKDEADLRIALNELRNKHTVLIDTVGVSQRDQMVAEQVAMLQGVGTDVQRILCMNATSTQETLSEVVRAYQGSGLAGAIITKLDEAASIGSALDVVIRHKLRLFYASNGQRVPEDLHLADPAALVGRAFGGQSAPKYGDAELPLLVAGAVHDPMLREVRFG
ncbi:flagellar biosynthesis protein FlhF [Duganella sp. Root336D2]|uniref:flagellar biosynthesis protein FlhF n=1 Tax=Duganella sp. Root336D2 TaxID=1736518 RepID=UPI0007012894|nr:flagellar biosynthesis protein FlhF [Duganella sp. Root336D2]KQV54221.1 flagellar biosynthesis protein FlhF [Duganella sp. Root336D2]